MNTIYYANLRTRKRAAIRIGQPSYTTLIGAQPGQRKNKQRPRPTMAEADRVMYASGFVRWPRNKRLPAEQQKVAA